MSNSFDEEMDFDRETPVMPWDQHPSIYEHVAAHVLGGDAGLSECGKILPDEQRIAATSKLRWAPGALDGVMGRHVSPQESHDQVRQVMELVLAYCISPTVSTKLTLYQHILQGNALPLIDPITTHLLQTPGLKHDRLFELAYSFTTEAPDREPVKFGIAMLGLYEIPDNVSIFQTLGLHEEFTLYAAVALSRISEDPELELWTLARVHGWGRIHIVDQLAETDNAQIKDWMLRHGYKNNIMYEYSAYTCATVGGMLAALSDNSIDREMLNSCGEILTTLVGGGPAEDINDYDDGAAAVELFLAHLEPLAEEVIDLVHVSVLRDYLGDDTVDWDDRAWRGWTAPLRSSLGAACERIMSRPDWSGKIRLALDGDNESAFHHANQVAGYFDIDPWDAWKRLQAQPLDSSRWFHVMHRCNGERIDEVIALARKCIELDKIATGPALELGLGPDWARHQCLDFILQALGKFPGRGIDLVEVGLQSPTTRNRHMAVAVLAVWDSNQWGDRLRQALERAASIEPIEDLQMRMAKVSRGDMLID